jgi:CRP/FNR family cyclic AMP-dependent transcriptional regulator
VSAASDLKAFALFASLSDTERAAVADLLERLDLDPGEQLFLEGQESEGLVLIESGGLRLSSGRAGDLGVVPAGETLGAVALVAPGRREVTAVASEDTRVWLLSRESFQRLILDEPRASCRMLEAALVDFAGLARLGLDRFAASAAG